MNNEQQHKCCSSSISSSHLIFLIIIQVLLLLLNFFLYLPPYFSISLCWLLWYTITAATTHDVNTTTSLLFQFFNFTVAAAFEFSFLCTMMLTLKKSLMTRVRRLLGLAFSCHSLSFLVVACKNLHVRTCPLHLQPKLTKTCLLLFWEYKLNIKRYQSVRFECSIHQTMSLSTVGNIMVSITKKWQYQRNIMVQALLLLSQYQCWSLYFGVHGMPNVIYKIAISSPGISIAIALFLESIFILLFIPNALFTFPKLNSYEGLKLCYRYSIHLIQSTEHQYICFIFIIN